MCRRFCWIAWALLPSCATVSRVSDVPVVLNSSSFLRLSWVGAAAPGACGGGVTAGCAEAVDIPAPTRSAIPVAARRLVRIMASLRARSFRLALRQAKHDSGSGESQEGSGSSFGRIGPAERRHAGAGEFVGALVVRVAGMAADPVPGDPMRPHRVVELLPEIDVLHGLPVGGAPAIGLPGTDPFRDALAQILRVRVDLDVARH